MTKVSLILMLMLACINAKSNRRVINFLRERRHLLFPDPKDSETRYQVLFGLGLPMEGEVSMTLGYVLKCNYNLPYNASDFSMLQRRSRLKRSGSGFALPRTTSRREGRTTTRWTLYGMLESTLNVLGSGKACLLRAVCEAAANPFDKGHGLLGELLHAFLTPSATREEYEIYSNREYHAAEKLGLQPHLSRSGTSSIKSIALPRSRDNRDGSADVTIYFRSARKASWIILPK
ncbi:uncharacterized protein LOC109857180 [Pseudomyrmex gracilis]|uniref:uncharacterized protein LOC109857180 n=1 Tax=Pseudomyrmex gracilis TaxID=219809 RepID=UPI000994BFE2|nr:uncharacterized protein LOC109857180 [Pseudomyrmex gracilis]